MKLITFSWRIFHATVYIFEVKNHISSLCFHACEQSNLLKLAFQCYNIAGYTIAAIGVRTLIGGLSHFESFFKTFQAFEVDIKRTHLISSSCVNRTVGSLHWEFTFPVDYKSEVKTFLNHGNHKTRQRSICDSESAFFCGLITLSRHTEKGFKLHPVGIRPARFLSTSNRDVLTSQRW